jgi:hypothetical protein
MKTPNLRAKSEEKNAFFSTNKVQSISIKCLYKYLWLMNMIEMFKLTIAGPAGPNGRKGKVNQQTNHFERGFRLLNETGCRFSVLIRVPNDLLEQFVLEIPTLAT